MEGVRACLCAGAHVCVRVCTPDNHHYLKSGKNVLTHSPHSVNLPANYVAQYCGNNSKFLCCWHHLRTSHEDFKLHRLIFAECLLFMVFFFNETLYLWAARAADNWPICPFTQAVRCVYWCVERSECIVLPCFMRILRPKNKTKPHKHWIEKKKKIKDCAAFGMNSLRLERNSILWFNAKM